MRTQITLIALAAAALCACSETQDHPSRGLASVNVPVVQRNDFSFDVAAPGGALPASEAARLDAWFRGMQLGYGDNIYLDGPLAASVRSDVGRVAGQYGMLVAINGAPVTAGQIAPGTVRVVVSRSRASVPNCPNWSEPSEPTFENKTMSTFGCAVNGNLAAMIANPEDLVHGRDPAAYADPTVASRAVDLYRTKPMTGAAGLQDTKVGGK